ncbi:MAG: RHS repeat-associated core domain-containing protein, partial [Coriobacteriia bacterium]
RYRAYYADAETGLFYLPARYYDPATYRFLSQDPAAPSAGDPLSLNAYAYCLGDPVSRSDPSGATIEINDNGRLDSQESFTESYIQTPDDSPYKEARRAGMEAATKTATDANKTAADVAKAGRAAYNSQMMQGMSAADAMRYCFGNFGDATCADYSRLVYPGSQFYLDYNLALIFPVFALLIGDIPVAVGGGPTGGVIVNFASFYDGHSEMDFHAYGGFALGTAGGGGSLMYGKGSTGPGGYRETCGGLGVGGAAGRNLSTGAGYAQGGFATSGISRSWFIVF